jgi:hypothetical protein
MDLSNDKEALTQTIGGERKGNVATLVPYNNPNGGITVPGFVQEQTEGGNVIVFVDDRITGRTTAGTMGRQRAGGFFGGGAGGARLRSESLAFDGFDRIEWGGLRGSIPG